MIHNKHVCVVLYDDEEYTTLVLECYWQSKTNFKYSYNCYIYECIYYSQQFLDKMVFYIISSWIYANHGIGLESLKCILRGHDLTNLNWRGLHWYLGKIQIHRSSHPPQAMMAIQEKDKEMQGMWTSIRERSPLKLLIMLILRENQWLQRQL